MFVVIRLLKMQQWYHSFELTIQQLTTPLPVWRNCCGLTVICKTDSISNLSANARKVLGLSEAGNSELKRLGGHKMFYPPIWAQTNIFESPLPSECGGIIENTTLLLYLLKLIQHDTGHYVLNTIITKCKVCFCLIKAIVRRHGIIFPVIYGLPWVVFTKPISSCPPFCYFVDFSCLSKHWLLPVEYHVDICQSWFMKMN